MRTPVESLDVWQLSHTMALEIYRTTKDFPKEERYGLAAQVRRAAVGIPANIAEGNARNSLREYVHFCHLARGSLAELRYLLRLARDLGLIDETTFEACTDGYDRVGKMLHYLIIGLRKRSQQNGSA
ncbi:MAG: four helix bundle protein [bacterium]